MTTEHILGLLPNRYPFLLMARVLEISDDRVSGVDAE
jgi:3-hydroxymyristoyl/3-hydroxydecanoyl-(acyl carrier protein) dehydratase